MFFFKVEISSFDDAAKTLFVVPEQHSDEQGVPFEDKMLTQTADFKQFVKSTQTCMVDGKYTQYKTDGVFESITEQQFDQLKAEGKVEELDSNSFSISTGFSPKKGGGKKDFKTLLIIGGAAIVLPPYAWCRIRDALGDYGRYLAHKRKQYLRYRTDKGSCFGD
ncbi:MAG: hypothetical protein ACI4J8_08035 [Oscillospiraceae bacterium]